jgi:hypothetical protein
MSAPRTRTKGSKDSAAAERAMRRKLARDLGKVIAYVAPASASASSQSVDFPSFVADLIEGVFRAIVDGSIQQMEAYADLMSDVAKSVDAFARDNVAAARARDHLVERYPCLSIAKRSLTRRASRQQLLATMVLMGINRIVVTDGKISAAPASRRRSR